ncbi:neoverrucotoxin subunit beta-like [Brachionus plicatilis]|uniref:Neoverrucotoxin subunit beta-like n=1 Tax=Brachionus plicatilis TaxID=10195 RepID=A0A3M7T253_BRAPC|nr:neoverrucotoxin subunit beta-like [Brachionus plicatilis]
MQDSLKLKFLGPSVQIGHLFDLRTNEVINISILNNNEKSTGIIKKIDINQTNYHYTSNDSYQERSKLLQINTDLKLEMLMGLIKGSSQSSYLNQTKKSARSTKYTFMLEIKKAFESLDFFEKEFINFQALENKRATHVIVGVHWGASFFSSFELYTSNHEGKDELMGKKKDRKNKFKHIHADIVPLSGLPKNGQEVLEFLKKFSSYVNNYNDGKGIPLEIELLSINSIFELFKIEQKFQIVLREISQNLVQQIESELENLVLKKQVINDLIDDCERYGTFLNKIHIEYLKEIRNNIEVNEVGFKEKARNFLNDVRSGDKDESVLWDILNDFLKSQYSSHGVSLILSESKCMAIEKKIKFIRNIEMSGLKMINNFQQDLNLFVNARDNRLVIHLRRSKAQAFFYVFDCENFGKTKETMSIMYYKHGRLINSNCFREEKPFARRFGDFHMQDSLRRKCPGFNVQLGYLYDARSERVVNMSILNTQNLPQEKIQLTEIKNTRYEHTFNDSYKEKYNNSELKLEIMCKSITLSGSVLLTSYEWFYKKPRIIRKIRNELKKSSRFLTVSYLIFRKITQFLKQLSELVINNCIIKDRHLLIK